jgi:hypothetical protein
MRKGAVLVEGRDVVGEEGVRLTAAADSVWKVEKVWSKE